MPQLVETINPSADPCNNVDRTFLSAVPARLKLTSVDDPDLFVEFPFGPQATAEGGLARGFKRLARPFRKPLLVADSPMLRTFSFSAFIADRESGGTGPITDFLRDLKSFADRASVVKCTYGTTAVPFSAVITALPVTVSRRNTEGQPIRATVQVKLEEAVSVSQSRNELGPVTLTPDPPPPPEDPDPEDDEGGISPFLPNTTGATIVVIDPNILADAYLPLLQGGENA